MSDHSDTGAFLSLYVTLLDEKVVAAQRLLLTIRFRNMNGLSVPKLGVKSVTQEDSPQSIWGILRVRY